MKSPLRFLFRLAHGTLLLLGCLSLLFVAAQFTNIPWRAYRYLSEIPDPTGPTPTHILVMGGSGIPGESGLMRTFFAAQAAAQYPAAEVLVAMPLDTGQSDASRAYLDEIQLRGIAHSRLRILAGGRNTREQALRFAETLAARTNPACVLIVTDPAHIRRTAACLRKACADMGILLQLEARPAFPVSIEDPLEYRAADLDHASAHPSAVPDIGASLHLRYNLWANLGYTQDALRENIALIYYRLRDWL